MRSADHKGLTPELALLLDAIRTEFDAKLTSLKLWGALALVCGGTLGGVVSQYVAPATTAAALHAVTLGLIS